MRPVTLRPDIKALSATDLIRLHNTGFGHVVQWLIASAGPFWRRTWRAEFVRHAGALVGGDPRTLPRRLWERLRALGRRPPSVAALDLATTDGAIMAVLLVNFGVVPHRTSIGRDLSVHGRRVMHWAPSQYGSHDESDEADPSR